ncbi:MAG: mechanosensitive ion channel family protein [Leptolyngbya sp. SIOISBB]|nr:mechanosensitive ion channel family protein [Leptolyngbya sp. SIOISBB]
MVLSCWAIALPATAQNEEVTPPPTEAPNEPPVTEPAPILAPNPQNPVINPFQNWTPSEVQSIFADSDELDHAAIHLDGRTLFEVAAPLNDEETLSAAERATTIETELEQIAAEFLQSGNPEVLNVYSEIDIESNQPVIYVNGQMLMTVTYLDARINGANSLTLRARQIVDDVETALIRYYEERQPAFLWQQVRWTLATLLITLLASFAISHFSHQISARRRRLKELPSPPSPSPGTESVQPADAPNVTRLRTTLLTKQQINSLGIIRELLQVLQVVLWAGSGLLLLGFFPQTRWLQPLVIDLMRLPVRLIVAGLAAYGLIQLASLWIDRLFLMFQGGTGTHLARSQRLVLRLSTFSQVIKGVVAVVIVGITILVVLSWLGVRVAPLIAGAGLIGFAISFASQSLIKDIINGFLVLVEDQYGVGDVITVGTMSGFVETMNLRITQLRATDGQLITIPNSQITIVQNLSKEWSRVDFMIPIGLTANINQALKLVEDEANAMRRDAIWGALILEPPLLLGVDDLTHAGATIRIWIKTQPLKQWDVAREYRRRLKIAFDTAQIPLGVPQQVVQLSGPHAPSRTLLNGQGTPESSPYSTPIEDSSINLTPDA